METNNHAIEKQRIRIKEPRHFKVMMHNDDFTSMEFVVDILIRVFNKDMHEAEKIMMDVHKKGTGVAGIYPYDIAVSKISIAMSKARELSYPFKLTVEEV